MDWDDLEADWQQGIAAASAYREANDDLRVPQKFVSASGFRLGHWIFSRRIERRRGMLSQERIAQLDALGMLWEPFDSDWKRGMNAASAYREANGDLRVPAKFVDDSGFRLGSWISNRRIERRRGTLSQERIAQLDALGMVWDARNARLPAAT